EYFEADRYLMAMRRKLLLILFFVSQDVLAEKHEIGLTLGGLLSQDRGRFPTRSTSAAVLRSKQTMGAGCRELTPWHCTARFTSWRIHYALSLRPIRRPFGMSLQFL